MDRVIPVREVIALAACGGELAACGTGALPFKTRQKEHVTRIVKVGLGLLNHYVAAHITGLGISGFIGVEGDKRFLSPASAVVFGLPEKPLGVSLLYPIAPSIVEEIGGE